MDTYEWTQVPKKDAQKNFSFKKQPSLPNYFLEGKQ